MPIESSSISIFPAMKSKALPLLFSANAISGFSQGISMLAIPWYFAKHNQGMFFNQAYTLVTLMVLVFSLFAGAWVDRYSRKKNFLAINLICGIYLAIISSVGIMQEQLNDILIVSAFALTMLNYNIHYPTLYAFAQEVTPAHKYERINSQMEVLNQSISVLSGGMAAMLLDGFSNRYFTIKAWTISEIFALDALTYFIAFALIYLIPYTHNSNHEKHIEPIFIRIKNGFEFLNQNRSLLIFGLFSYAVFAMLLVEIHAVLPSYVKWHLKADGSVFAIADTIYAVGALSAGLFIRKTFNSIDNRISVMALTILVAFLFYWAWLSCQVWIIYTVSILLGFGNAGIRILRLSYLFRTVPNAFMGRVGSIFNIANVCTRSIFIWIFSSAFFSNSDQIVWAYFTMAVFLTLAFIILLLNYFKNPIID